MQLKSCKHAYKYDYVLVTVGTIAVCCKNLRSICAIPLCTLKKKQLQGISTDMTFLIQDKFALSFNKLCSLKCGPIGLF